MTVGTYGMYQNPYFTPPVFFNSSENPPTQSVRAVNSNKCPDWVAHAIGGTIGFIIFTGLIVVLSLLFTNHFAPQFSDVSTTIAFIFLIVPLMPFSLLFGALVLLSPCASYEARNKT